MWSLIYCIPLLKTVQKLYTPEPPPLLLLDLSTHKWRIGHTAECFLSFYKTVSKVVWMCSCDPLWYWKPRREFCYLDSTCWRNTIWYYLRPFHLPYVWQSALLGRLYDHSIPIYWGYSSVIWWFFKHRWVSPVLLILWWQDQAFSRPYNKGMPKSVYNRCYLVKRCLLQSVLTHR